MITISILGLDQFVVGDYSREITKKIADAYEINEDEILFYAPQAFIFHKGFDQWGKYTKWTSKNMKFLKKLSLL